VRSAAIALLAISIAMSGCTTKRQASIVMAVGGAVAFGGLLRVELCTEDGNSVGDDCYDALLQGLGVGLIGGTILLGGVVGMLYSAIKHDPDAEEAARDDAARDDALARTKSAPTTRIRRRDEARLLTKLAAAAATAGDCTTVKLIDPQVLALDAESHRTVFVVDVAIRRCQSPTAMIPLAEEEANQRRRENAGALTFDARAAALAGECDAVRKLGRQVFALDAEFHNTVFLADIGIKRCLAPTAPPTDPAPAPQAPPP